MSLNGLDDAKVTEAYQSALAEAGGWFLLKYASRDAVDILTRGTGGLAEARNAVAQYEDKSPLYGFLLYRRRKVLIKHIPEGTSRLLQARVTVHFQAVTEKFTPHDTIFSITTADELNDTALSSACALHTAAPSSCSSSGSSRKQKLDGITEDAEEGQADVADETAPLVRPPTSASIPTIIEPNGEETPPRAKPEPIPEPPETSMEEPTLTKTQISEEVKPPVARAATEPAAELPTLEKMEKNTSHYRDHLKDFEAIVQNGPDPRFSSQTARPSYQDMYNTYYELYSKPKVKLGPRPALASSRPSVDSIKRPHTSGNGARDEARPVSQLPAGLRVATRKSVLDSKRPKSRDSSAVPSIAIPPPPPIPNIPDIPLGSSMRATTSAASVKSMPATGHRSAGLTPEKQRLMKALELRKKRQKAQKEKEAKKAEAAQNGQIAQTTNSASPGPPARLSAVKEAASPEEDREAEGTETGKPNMNEQGSQEETPRRSSPPPPPEHSKEDSAVELSNQADRDDIQSSASASSPTSAQTKASSDTTSTRPSSISEEDTLAPELKPEFRMLSTEVTPTPPRSAHSQEERDSIESSPTVVPDDVPSASLSEVATHPSSQPTEPDKRETSPAEKEERLPTEDSAAQPKRKSIVEVREKRRALIDPIDVHLRPEDSDVEYQSDDSFMDELESAKFEEAKPISVAKSPMSSFFPRKSSVAQVKIPERSSSSRTMTDGQQSQEQFSRERTPSPPYFHRTTEDNMVAKKVNVSSGISQRIKALAEKSNRDSTASISPTATPDGSNSIVAQRKSSFFTQSPSVSPPSAQQAKRLSRVSVATFSSPSPNRQSFLHPLSTPSLNNHHHESVQVTARIIRDPRTQVPNLTVPTESTPLELHQSPIIVDHKKASMPPPSRSKSSPVKLEPISSIPPSSPVKDAAIPRSSSESSWRSIGRRMSESKSGAATIRSQSTNSLESFDERREDKKDKKDSRTTRLFKRMSSSISSASRKGLSQARSPVLKEEDDEYVFSHRLPPPAVQVGDLNVQFPDTLLWKRRWVEVDGMGNLVLSLSKANDQSRGITKRFHLREFRTPYAPDQDSQELPNSVILDFLDGRTLQCACETYMAQVQVLQILREAHDAWLACGQVQ